MIDGRAPIPEQNDESDVGSTPPGSGAGDPSGGMLSGAMTMSGINDENIAAEAAVDGAAADAERGERQYDFSPPLLGQRGGQRPGLEPSLG